MLAYPTPTFDAKTIRAAPGFRPLGKAGETVPSNEVVAETPLNKVNRHTANGGYVGSRAKHFIQNNQFLNEKYDPVKGTPLSKVGSVGNVGDQFIAAGRPYMAEPKNEELRLIMNILDGKPLSDEQKGKLTAKQVRAMGEKTEKLNQRPEAGIIDDLADAQDALKKSNRIRNAMAQGFTLEEANKAYAKLREKEAEAALFKQQDTSVRLYDLIDSKMGGLQSPLVPGNDESALALARGENKELVKRAEIFNAKQDKAAKFDNILKLYNEPDLLSFPKGNKSILDQPISALESMLDKSIRKPTVAETLAGANITVMPTKRRGRPPGRTDTLPRTRRPQTEVMAERKALAERRAFFGML